MVSPGLHCHAMMIFGHSRAPLNTGATHAASHAAPTPDIDNTYSLSFACRFQMLMAFRALLFSLAPRMPDAEELSPASAILRVSPSTAIEKDGRELFSTIKCHGAAEFLLRALGFAIAGYPHASAGEIRTQADAASLYAAQEEGDMMPTARHLTAMMAAPHSLVKRPAGRMARRRHAGGASRCHGHTLEMSKQYLLAMRRSSSPRHIALYDASIIQPIPRAVGSN